MADPSASPELPPEMLRLTRGERAAAVPIYQKFIQKFDAERPDMHDDNKRQALNAAYAMGGKCWLMFVPFFSIPGAIWLSISKSVGPIVLLAVAGVFVCLSLWRLFQALRFFPHWSVAHGLVAADK
jgi:hypothetical protein